MVVINKKIEKLIERVTLLYFYMPLITFFEEGFSENTNKKLATKNMWVIVYVVAQFSSFQLRIKFS